jgi:hypothetical protein
LKISAERFIGVEEIRAIGGVPPSSDNLGRASEEL